MPFKEALFWVGITIFGTGLYFMLDGDSKRMLLNATLTLAGFGAVVYSVWSHYDQRLPKFPLWVYLLVITWLFIGYDMFERHRAALVTPPSAVTQPASVDALPTNLGLQFGGEHTIPVAIGSNNIYRWYALKNIFMSLDSKTGKFRESSTWNVFMTFDKPITFGQITIDTGGSVIPQYEVKDTSQRTAVIAFSGDLTGVVIEIRAMRTL